VRVLRSLRARIVGAILLVTAAGVVQSLLVADPIIEGEETRRMERELAAIARTTVARLARGADANAVADEVGSLASARVAIFGARGELLGDSADLAQRAGESEARALEVVAARTEGSGTAVRVGRGSRDERLFVAVRAEGGVVVRVDRSLAPIVALRRQLRFVVVGVGLAALLLAWLLSELLTRSLVRPLAELGRAADALAAGEVSVRVRSQRKDELGLLARSLDRMADAIDARIARMGAEEAQLRTILDAMVEGVLVTDREGRIRLTNAALQKLAGRVEGRTAVEAIRSAELHEAVEGALRGESSSVTLEIRVGVESRMLAAQVAPLPARSGVVAVLHDVTELKLADTVRRDFVANASHELRTPLTAIRGFAETLADGAIGDPVLAKRFLGRILEHAVRLQRLVDDLLELSRAESPDVAFTLGPVDVGAAVSRALRGLERNAAEKQITLSAEGLDEEPIFVEADAVALDHVLVNLVDNGVKYTPEGGRVTVSIDTDTEEGVVIEVSDTGGGIAPQNLPRIFERFYRVDSGRAREVGGTGLGLAIVKHLVQRMGGEVGVESRLGRGTTFRVVLRRAEPSEDVS
jgi:two-component system phosphate regulon sensor histidine kinase PhoR